MPKAKMNPLPIEVLEITNTTGDRYLTKVLNQMLELSEAPPLGGIEDARVSVAVAYVRVGIESLVVGSGADLPGIHNVLLGIFSEISEVYKEDYMAREDTKILLAQMNKQGSDKPN